jgi:toxin ParE1/3/4
VRPVIWSPDAIRDVQGIHDYIEPFNPAAAVRIAAGLLSATDLLENFPDLGRPGIDDTREWGFRKYVIVYETRPSETRILNVWHGAQDRPGSRPPVSSQ